MYRYLFGRDGRTERIDRYSRGRWRRRWPQSRAMGCLLWLLILVVILVILSLMFGGFQKGSKATGLAGQTAARAMAPAAASSSLPGPPGGGGLGLACRNSAEDCLQVEENPANL